MTASNGLSPAVVMIFSHGLNSPDPVRNARLHMNRLLTLPIGFIRTREDVEAVCEYVAEWTRDLPENDITPAMKLVIAYAESLREAQRLSLAAE